MVENIEKISNETRSLVNQFFIDNWFSTDMSLRGKIIDGTKLDGFILKEENTIIGLVTYTFFENICEIVSLDSKRENIGIGSSLLKEVEKVAIDNNCKKMRLITTNDNMRALQFYQKRGYCLSKLYPNAMDEVRKVKPNVPDVGDNDIPLRDEVELEKIINKDMIKINKVEKNKLYYIDLLLSADPDKEVVMKYIQEGDMFVLTNKGIAIAEIFIMPVNSEVCELKNIATVPDEKGNGFAKMLIQHAFNEYKGKFKRMIVGTTENMIPFYVLNGFTKYYKTVKNFFVDNYKEEVWDGNLHCMDMYYYSKEL